MQPNIHHTPLVLNRRAFVFSSLAAGGLLALPSIQRVEAAKQATDLASLGLPTLDITVSATGYEGIPESLPAGRYLVTATIGDDVEDGTVSFVQPPPGMSAADFLTAIGLGPDSSGAEASPAPEDSEEDEGPLPSFVYKATFAGGVVATPGETAAAVIDLGEGEWFAWADGPETPFPPVIFTATGSMPESPVDPGADLTFTLYEFGIMVDGAMTAGDHLVLLENVGAQPHFLVLQTVPDGTTNDDLTALIDSFMSGTPVPGGLSESDITDTGSAPTQSLATSTWRMMSFAAGTYAASCWFPNAGTGQPHAFMGMRAVFEITA